MKSDILKMGRSNEKYRFVFVAAFCITLFVLLPSLVYTKGIFIYYGDFNSQQIPFYQHAHDMIRQGAFGWDWGSDLGSSFIGSFSFYLLGSPFFWLTIPFPSGAVPYLIPWLLALKTGVAALTSYAYIRRFVKSEKACAIGALLYALSGFQVYNIFFNHFHDVVAFFPLLLIALEERIQNNRRGVFALAVALCAMVNYFFFTGQVTFLIIYFIVRCFSKDFNITFKKFLGLALESVLGVMIAAVLFLPAVLAVLSNPRLDNQLFGHDMVVYSDRFRIFRIIQGFFMIPDPPGRSNLFTSTTAKWASMAGYLPLFSMAGVIAFMKEKKKHWSSRIIIICIVFAFVPFLNSMFYAFNGSYYARWYYMPILIMCVMTAYVLDNKKMSFKAGLPACTVILGILLVTALLPTKDKGVVTFGNLPKYKIIFWASMAVSLICLALLWRLTYVIKKDGRFLKKATSMTVACAVMCTATVVWYGMIQGPYPDEYVSQAINGGKNITLDDKGDSYFRIDTSEACDNFPMFWGYSSMRAFNSVVSGSIMSFYENLGITRDVASRIDTSRYPLRGLLSVKFYFNQTSGDNVSIPGFKYKSTQNGFNIYENEYYVPMGFTFDYYVTKRQFESQMNASRDMLLMKGLYLTDEQIKKYSDILKPLPDEEMADLYNPSVYLDDCIEKKGHTAYYFKNDTNGFTAKINLDKENLVFFSVPYDDGFSATVNGTKATIEKVDDGLMAVRCPAGKDIEIKFTYKTCGLKAGMALTLTGVVLLAAYLVVCRKLCPNSKKQEFVYDYESMGDEEDDEEYEDDEDDDTDEEDLSEEADNEKEPDKSADEKKTDGE